MKPDWDKLGDEFADSNSVVIGDADCTGSAKELCETHNIRGYPTIKYFTSESGSAGSDYQGGRSFDDLKTFVDDELATRCLVDDTAGCSDREKEYIGKFKAKPAADVKTQLDRLQGMTSGSMTPALKWWLNQRVNILKQL